MKPMLIVTLVLVASACGKKKPEPGPEPGSGSAPVIAVDTGGLPDDPTPGLVKEAFAGKAPAMPLLDKGGGVAAAELSAPAGLTGVSTYAVEFVPTTGAPEKVSVVDAKLAHALAGGSGKPDRESLQRAAASIAKRLGDGGFTPFEGKIDEVAPGEPEVVGPGKIQLATVEDEALVVTVFDAAGNQLSTETIKPVPMGKAGEIDCVSLPMPRSAAYDNTRKRILLRIGWNAGPDQCDAPDAVLRLYAIP